MSVVQQGRLTSHVPVAPALVVFLLLTSLSPGAAAAAPAPDAGLTPLVSESLVASFETNALAEGALGFYRGSDDALVVVLPRDLAVKDVGTIGDPGIVVRLERRDLTEEQLDRVLARLAALWNVPAMSGEGYRFGFDPETGKVQMRGTADAGLVQSLLGDDSGLVSYAQDSLQLQSRHSDTPSFSGGAELKRVGSANSYDCTSGFSVKNSLGTTFMMTAGHCGGVLDKYISPGNGQAYGDVDVRQVEPYGDLETISGRVYGGAIYTTDTVRTAVRGAADPVVGRAIYCRSGATTHTQCGLTVQNLNYMDCSNGPCFNYVEYTGGPEDRAQGGDSGAPIYLSSGGLVYIRGLHIGALTANPDDMFGEKWSKVVNLFHVSIVTG